MQARPCGRVPRGAGGIPVSKVERESERRVSHPERGLAQPGLAAAKYIFVRQIWRCRLETTRRVTATGAQSTPFAPALPLHSVDKSLYSEHPPGYLITIGSSDRLSRVGPPGPALFCYLKRTGERTGQMVETIGKTRGFEPRL